MKGLRKNAAFDFCGEESFAPKRNKNASSTKHDVDLEFYGLPPIGQKVAAATRPMDGAQFHPLLGRLRRWTTVTKP
jgi:hypothetical protein